MNSIPEIRPVRRATVAFILITVFLDILAFGLIIPVFPHLIASFVGDNLSEAAKWHGIFATAFMAMQFVFSPIQGALSDRFGRRPVILISNLGLGLDFILMALAPTLPWLFIARVLSGITSSSFSTANAYIADVTPPEKRAQAFGMLGMDLRTLCRLSFWLGSTNGRHHLGDRGISWRCRAGRPRWQNKKLDR